MKKSPRAGIHSFVAAPTTPHLTCEIIDGPVPVVRVHGELDLATAGRLCRTVQAVSAVRRRSRVMIDLTELAFCDSTGLRALMGAVREIEINGGKAALAVLPGSPLDRIFELAGMHEFLRVADSPEAALRRLGVD